MFTQEELNYSYDALEPVIDEKTMEIHYSKHHAGYVAKLNKALHGNDELMKMSIEELISDVEKLPEGVRTSVRNNGGGHANHTLFWSVMTPGGTGSEEMIDLISDQFGSFEKFQEEFTNAATSRFGSGWAWLVKVHSTLEVVSTPNQDSPLMEGKVPILGLDVWEHAYYLKYQNKRAEYVENWWKIVNWEEVLRRYENG